MQHNATTRRAPPGSWIGKSAICAVVVTYFPKLACAANLAALAPQVGKLLIVDNGSSSQTLEPVEAAAQPLDATVVRVGSNLGIAAALNVGLKLAREQGYRWLATFDQDSQATPGMIEEMVRALGSFSRPDVVGVITPCHVDRRSGVAHEEPRSEAADAGWRIITSAMTSGNLVNIEAASAVGGFDASLFIDYVDHEFCLRLRAHGYQILEATRARLLHSLGDIERRQFLFKRVTVTNHPTARRYYISRNRLMIWRGYWRREPHWVIRDIRGFVFETVYIVLYEKHAGAKLRMILRGLLDGTRGVRGAFDPGR